MHSSMAEYPTISGILAAQTSHSAPTITCDGKERTPYPPLEQHATETHLWTTLPTTTTTSHKTLRPLSTPLHSSKPSPHLYSHLSARVLHTQISTDCSSRKHIDKIKPFHHPHHDLSCILTTHPPPLPPPPSHRLLSLQFMKFEFHIKVASVHIT